jgi:predicted permease
MPDLKELVSRRLRHLWPDGRIDSDVVDELTTHLQDRYDELRAAGRSEREATEATLTEMIDSEQFDIGRHKRRRQIQRIEAEPPSSSGSRLIDLGRDMRYGARLIARNPGFTALVVLTLAFGIAANTVAFTVINTLLLSPLPVASVEELVKISTRDTADPANARAEQPLSYPNLLDVQSRNDALRSLAGVAGPFGITLTGQGRPERIFAELVTANYFDTLGVRPFIGRFFLSEEDRTRGSHAVLVLGYDPWQSRFGGRPDILGRTIEINRVAFTVVGVAPRGFKGLDPVFGPDVWIPSMMTGQIVPAEQRGWLDDRAASAFNAVARLRPGVTAAQAQASLDAVAAQLVREHPKVNRGRGLAVAPLSRAALMGVSPGLAVVGSVALLAIPGLVLLIACSNVANLLLARATARRQEIALRLALGAGRSRIVRQLLTESSLLGAISGVAGLGAALAGVRLLSSLRPAEYARNLVDVTLDANVVFFAVVLSAVMTAVFGLAPALHASRSDLVTALNDEARTAGQQKRSIRIRRVLLMGQVALSLMALITAGLFLRSIQRAYVVDPGFEREHLGILMLNPGQAGYDRARVEQLYRTVKDRIATLPGVASVSWSSNLPLFSSPSRKIAIEGRSEPDDRAGVLTVVNTVDAEYFATMGIGVERGRAFTDADRASSLPVAIINETLAHRYWPDGDPIGQRLLFVGDTVPRQIVGVARTANYDNIGETPQPCVYLPLAQHFTDLVVLNVRTRRDPSPVLTAVQREVRAIDDNLDVGDVRTIQKVIDQALFGTTMGGGLLGMFGLLALGLASLGMYGVMAYTVTLRRREIGVRLALGAESGAVLRLVLRDGLKLVTIGLVIGAFGAAAISTLLSRFLYGLSPLDPASFAGAAVVLLTVAAAACYFPARRASRLDPLDVLRSN